MTTPAPSSSFWISPSLTNIDSICLGTGRFLRAVWIPALQAAHYHPILIQPRGRSFVDYCLHQAAITQQSATIPLPVDTVLPSGDIQTDSFDCYGAFSWGTPSDETHFQEWFRSVSIDTTKSMFLIAVGVTEAGLASAHTPAMQQLYRLLFDLLFLKQDDASTSLPKIGIINTDNVPHNGNVIRSHMLKLLSQDPDGEPKRQFLEQKVVFFNTMVDRITSHRPNDPLVPRAEPSPAKALVVADLHQDLPFCAFVRNKIPGVVIRSTLDELQQDIMYKLRIANGTHTAVAHALALSSFPQTDVLASSSNTKASAWFLTYLDALVQHQILVSLDEDAIAVWDDWRPRLLHPHFGLSSFFIAQNGAAKGGIRLGPTVCDLLQQQQQQQSPPKVTVAMAWAFAVLLRYLTPVGRTRTMNNNNNNDRHRYRGWLSQFDREQVVTAASLQQQQNNSNPRSDTTTEEYADQLAFNLQEGWYDFRCTCTIQIDDDEACNLSDCLASNTNGNYRPIVRAYLVAEQGGKMQDVSHLPYFEVFVTAVSRLYAELVCKNHILDSLEHLIKTNALNQDCQTLVSDESSATN